MKIRNSFLALAISILSLSFNIASADVADYDYVVIGGGVSGLAACVELIKNGVPVGNIKLLEASDHLGGRIESQAFTGGKFIEIGAQFLHGTTGNPAYEILSSLNEVSTADIFTNARVYYATQDGAQLKEEFVDKLMDSVMTWLDEVRDTAETLKTNSLQNVGFYLDQKFTNLMKTKAYKNADKKLAAAIYRGKQNDEIVDYAVKNFYDLSAVGLNNYQDLKGEEFTVLKTSYFKLIEYFEDQIDSNSILLNKKVTNIDYTNGGTGTVTVKTTDTQTNTITNYQADFVITTIPMGYLKENYNALFTPSLPSTHSNAIKNLGFGTMNKLFFVFGQNVFKKREQGLGIFWRDDQSINLPIADARYGLANNRFYNGLSSFQAIPGYDNVLFAFITGDAAIKSEQVSDDCLKDVAHEIFTKFFPQLRLTRPTQIVRSRWNSSPYIKGSYTYYKVGSFKSDVKNLNKPLKNSVYFAGEGTSDNFMGTVHGALLSGRNAAKSIIKRIKAQS